MNKNNKQRQGPLTAILGNKRWQFISIPVFAILCSLVAISVIILLVGKNPITAFQSLLQGSGLLPKPSYSAYKSMLTDFMDTLDALTPMLLAALGVAVAFKAGLFNIGISGQMLFAGFMATVMVGYSGLPAVVAKPLVIVIGLVSGALIGGLIGFLKYKFNINEVVSSIMLNYILQYIISFFISTKFIDPVSRQSRNISAQARLTLLNVQVGGVKMRVPIVILLAVVLAVVLWVFLSKTKQGYELKAVGLNPVAAKYAGVNVGKNTVLALTISGGLAGLAGVSYYLGYYQSIQPGTLAGLGFDSIAVSLLGNSHPIGIIFSSLLISVISRGSIYMSSTVGVRQEIASLVTGMILLFSACGGYIRSRVNTAGTAKAKKGGKAE